MATGWSTVTKENTNFARLCHFLIDGGTQVLRDIFDAKHPPPDLKKHLLNPTNHRILKNLKSKKILRPEQWEKLYPSVEIPTSASFDITLLSLLLRDICSLPIPANGWDKEPAATSINQEDDIVRIRLFRNNLHGHIPTAALSDVDFNTFWSDIESVLVRLGADKEAIDNLKIQSMDSEGEEYYIQCIQEWVDYEKTVLKALEETEKRLGQKMDQGFEQIREAVLPSESTGKLTLEDLELYLKNLKEAITKQTDMQLPKGIIDEEAVKTYDIFTNLTIHHGDKKSAQQIKRPRMDHPFRKTITQIQHCSQIFVDESEGKKSKRVVVAGEPGIGKTLFSHKIIRDMAKNCITVPDIKFTYLITFRQLNLLDEEKLSLRELLNLCPLLNEKTMINDALIEYIIGHPEQLFVVFDGFDEYKHDRKIYGNCECRFPNDVKAQMPVHALVSKLIQKKILAESTIMVTSRPGEAKDLYQRISFDQYVEITGFSESQIIEYVEKYFNSRPEEAMTEEEKKKAIDIFKGTAHYMAFGRVPLRCFLMCPVIEWEIKNRSQLSGVVTLTEFYHDVIHCLERHNRERREDEASKKSASLDVTLGNLSRLAAQLHQENRFSFTLEDLDKLELKEKELLYIKSSNLVYCCPVASDNSKYGETHIEYCFAHLTIQEFFVACHLVSKKEMPAKEASDMVYIFLGGLLGLNKNDNDNLMLNLLKCVGKRELQGSHGNQHILGQRLLSLRCLYEYGKDSELTTEELTENFNNRYWDNDKRIALRHITDMDCNAVAMLIEKLSAASLASELVPHTLDIAESNLACTGLQHLLRSIATLNCNITKLKLEHCQLDDTCVAYLTNHCPCSNIKCLDLSDNQITDVGVRYLTDNCPSNLREVILSKNQVTENDVYYMVSHCPSNLNDLYLDGNPISNYCYEKSQRFCRDHNLRLSIYLLSKCHDPRNDVIKPRDNDYAVKEQLGTGSYSLLEERFRNCDKEEKEFIDDDSDDGDDDYDNDDDNEDDIEDDNNDYDNDYGDDNDYDNDDDDDDIEDDDYDDDNNYDNDYGDDNDDNNDYDDDDESDDDFYETL